MPFFPGVHSVFGLTMQQTVLVKWLFFYASIYELDEVRRPPEDIIADDEAMDAWYERFTDKQRKKLQKYYKSVDKDEQVGGGGRHRGSIVVG